MVTQVNLTKCICAALILYVTACATNGSSDSQDQETSLNSVASPANIKCLEDGYEVIPDIVDGVPIGSWCVNKITNTRCDTWDYYRNSCHL